MRLYTQGHVNSFELQLTIHPFISENASALFFEIKKEVEKYSIGKNSHDWGHVERVFKLCMHIGKKEDADLEILGFAALLHDIGRPYQDISKGKICHAKKGASIAKLLLEAYNVSNFKIDKIVDCIQFHRFRSSRKPRSLEAKILYDADKLDSIGAIGIGRAFLFAGEIGANLYNDDDVIIEKTKPYTENDTAYREFVVKFTKVKSKMFTKEGKRLAEGRYQFAEYFFDRFKREIRGEI